MALGKKCGPLKSRRGAKKAAEEVDLGLELGRGYYTRGFGRKRIAVLRNTDDSDSNLRTPSKKRFSKSSEVSGTENGNGNGTGTALESLPQDVLIRILCGVDHDDLEQLVHVSKTIREVTLAAKQCHFAYTTPKKSRRTCFELDLENDFNNWDDIEAPAAPRRFRSRPGGTSLAGISVALFASPDGEEQWPRKDLLMDMMEM